MHVVVIGHAICVGFTVQVITATVLVVVALVLVPVFIVMVVYSVRGCRMRRRYKTPCSLYINSFVLILVRHCA